MKKSKLFAKIVYFVFTFGIGILLALFLPYFYMYYGESVSIIDESLKKGEYDKAMEMVGGYFDRRYVLQLNFDVGGGIVLFPATTLAPGETVGAETTQDGEKLQKSYSGFIYGVRYSYDIIGNDSKAKLIVRDADGNVHNVAVLDYDSDGNKTEDSNATHLQKGFIFLDLDMDTTNGSIKSLTIVDKDGNAFVPEITLNLSYSEQFFTDVNDFYEEYNRNYKSDKLTQLDKEFREKDENYAISSQGVAQSSADRKSAIVVVVYFVVIYIIADMLFYRYIIKFFRWLLVKVFKVKFKQKEIKRDTSFGNDYYSKVTFALDVSGLEDFSESVQIRYNSENGEEIAFLLLKEQNYTETKRIKAGTYVNMWIDLDRKYATQNLPENLVVEGYQKGYKIKIIKREE